MNRKSERYLTRTYDQTTHQKICFNLTLETVRKLGMLAAMHGITKSEMAAKIVNEYLDVNKSELGKMAAKALGLD